MDSRKKEILHRMVDKFIEESEAYGEEQSNLVTYYQIECDESGGLIEREYRMIINIKDEI